MTQAIESRDGIKWTPTIEVHKFGPSKISALTAQLGHEPNGEELAALGIQPDEIVRAVGNQLTNVGRNRIVDLIRGSGAAAFTAAQGLIGVGSSATAFAGTETALLGDGSAASARYNAVLAQPSLGTTGQLNASATFQTGDANFAWNEWGFAIATGTITAGSTLAGVGTSPVLLNRKVQALGTKASGAVWTLNAAVTIT